MDGSWSAADSSLGSPEISFGADLPVVTSGVSGSLSTQRARIVIGGDFTTVSGKKLVNQRPFALARVEADGVLDTTFGSGGTVVTTTVADQRAIAKLLQQTNGEIVAVGMSNAGSGSQNLAIARYLAQ